MELSKNAKLVALALFPFGVKSKTVFHPSHSMQPEVRSGILELLECGMIEPLPISEMPMNGEGYRGTENIGFPAKLYHHLAVEEE